MACPANTIDVIKSVPAMKLTTPLYASAANETLLSNAGLSDPDEKAFIKKRVEEQLLLRLIKHF